MPPRRLEECDVPTDTGRGAVQPHTKLDHQWKADDVRCCVWLRGAACCSLPNGFQEDVLIAGAAVNEAISRHEGATCRLADIKRGTRASVKDEREGDECTG